MFYPELIHVPPVLDFEASSLSDTSYPVSAGLIVEGRVHYWIIKPKVDWIDWSLPSQAIHGLKRSYIEEHGIPADQVFAEILSALAGHTVIYSDAPHWESMWLRRLGTYEIQIHSIADLIGDKMEVFSNELITTFELRKLSRHRADHDALAIAITLKRFLNSFNLS